MKDEKATKEKLLDSGKQEFLEKGYMKASLRTICKNAGVTTGALYFFFQDKEDLFASLVEKPLEQMFHAMEAHYREEAEEIQSGGVFHEEDEKDLQAAAEMIRYIFLHRDIFDLVLNKSQGSRFEHCLDAFIEVSQQHYRMLADHMCKQLGVEPLEDGIIHWLSHMQIEMFTYIANHIGDEEQAVQYVKKMVTFIRSGWFGLFTK